MSSVFGELLMSRRHTHYLAPPRADADGNMVIDVWKRGEDDPGQGHKPAFTSADYAAAFQECMRLEKATRSEIRLDSPPPACTP